MSILLSGAPVREAIKKDLLKRREKLSRSPVLAIVAVNPDSRQKAYIAQKKKFAGEVGAIVREYVFAQDEEKKMRETIQELNQGDVDGIIVQLPLPQAFDARSILEVIQPEKDVDGLGLFNIGHLALGIEKTIPATVRGILSLLAFYKIPIARKKVTIVGRSLLVGKPLLLALLNRHATVSVCHRKTVDLVKETQSADVLIVAAGSPMLIGEADVHLGQVVIDVGLSSVKGEKFEEETNATRLVGDVDFARVKNKVKALTPVPGGVGPLTVASLFQNLFDACERRVFPLE